MAERRPAGYPKLKNYKPSRFMLPTSHYDKAKADRAVKFIEKLAVEAEQTVKFDQVLAASLAGAADP